MVFNAAAAAVQKIRGRGVRTPLAAMPVRVSVVKIDTQEKLTVE